jgi:hypothetical protein
MKKLLMIFILMLFTFGNYSSVASNDIQGSEGKKALAILGDAHHPVFPLYLSIVKEIQKKGYETEVIMDYDVPFEDFSEYNLIVISRYAYNDLVLSRDYNFDFSVAKENLWLSADQELAFEDFVSKGGSLLIHHDGFGFYPKDGAITRLARAYFINHPPIGEITIKPVGDYEELSSNIEPFTVKDEEYVVEMDESQTNVFLESHSEKNGRHAQGWAHEYGNGKVVVLIPGHDRSILNHPMFKKCLTNVVNWLDK